MDLLRVLCVFVFLSVLSLSADPTGVLLYSDFEGGQTYLAADVKAGAKRMDLMRNRLLQEWPEGGGEGVVEYNLPEAREKFSYQKRVGHKLLGVRGIARPHPMGADIRFGSLEDWTLPANEFSETEGGIRIASHPEMTGSHCAHLSVKAANQTLRYDLGVKQKARNCRLHVLFGQSFFRKAGVRIPLLAMKSGLYSLERVFISLQPGKDRAFFTFGENEGGAVLLRKKDFAGTAILPNRMYRLEYSIAYEDSNTVTASLHIDGVLQFQRTTRQTLRRGQDEDWVSIGNNANASYPDGDPLELFVDEVIVSESPRNLPPVQPELTHKHGILCRAPGHGRAESLAAAQWQLSRTNSWLLPDFNSGMDVVSLDSLAIPFEVSVSAPIYSAEFPKGEPAMVPTRIKPDRRYFARCRTMNSNNLWSEFSEPVSVQSPGRSDSDQRVDLPVIETAFLANPGSEHALHRVRPGEWCDLVVRIIPNRDWDGLAYVDILLNGDPERNLGNYSNRGGGFDERSNYGFNFSLARPERLYVKEKGGEKAWRSVGYVKRSTVDNTGRAFAVDPQNGTVRARVRLTVKAVTGPWVLNAYAWTLSSQVSTMYSRIFHVNSDPDASEAPKRPGTFWILVAIALLAGVCIVVLAVVRKGRGTPRNKEKSESGELVHLDIHSPYYANIRKARQFMEENYQKGITAADVASAINVSRNWLSKFFGQGTGKSVIQYINELRVEQAKKLLLETDQSISEISFNVGFTSLRNFYQIFGKQVGEGPKKYRDLHSKRL